ncbi:hypothetical protein Tco_0506817 [Tanacetum coccineum]
MDKRKKHFAKLKAEEIRRKPPTKAQKRNQMCTYLKNMANYKHSQLKNKSFEEIQMLFDNTMKWVDSFVPMDTEVVEGSKSQAEGSKKRTREELESDNSKKQKIDENVEAKVDDEAEMKKLMEIVPDDEVAIDAIPLATKSPIIVDWKIIKEGKMGYFQIIRADGSSRRYSSMIRMLQNIDREDLETLWKLVKAKHGNTRPEEAYERVLWGDLKVMFEPDVESEVWRNLQGYNVTVWKLFSSSGVHFVRFQNLHIFMLVEKKYPLTPATITKMLNKKLLLLGQMLVAFDLLRDALSAIFGLSELKGDHKLEVTALDTLVVKLRDFNTPWTLIPLRPNSSRLVWEMFASLECALIALIEVERAPAIRSVIAFNSVLILLVISLCCCLKSASNFFNSYKDAKTLMQAIENRFGGNAATKKTQKNLLKQQYENFAASSTKVIEQTYERLQKLISQLRLHVIVILQKTSIRSS